MSVLGSLPTPTRASGSSTLFKNDFASENRVILRTGKAPSYPNRKGFIPRTAEDFGDGGAYPEIHVAQYPLEMGRKKGTETKSVPVQLDSEGRVKYESVLGGGDKRIIQARHDQLIASKVDEDEIRRPDPETEAETTLATKQALEKVLQGKLNSAQATNVEKTSGDAQYIRYTPSQKTPGAPESRIIRLTEAPSDPLEPPKFKQKKAPRGPPSPPVPVMHSPPRKVTVKDQQDWKIPPCISNWKNRKGYTIPLDKRLAADGRGLQETIINDNFAKFSESLYIAERVAREEVSKRADVENRIKIKEKEKKEEMLRKLAQEARMERAASQVSSTEDEQLEEGRRERDQIREERRRERERDLRMQRNKSAASRNEERDVSERIALGMNVPQSNTETQYDQRLFNQSQGMDSGFGDEDSYNVYSKPLFHASSANALYRPKKGDTDNYGGEEDYNKLTDTSKFRPDKEFSGAGENAAAKGSTARDKPVEFEKVQNNEDLFGLDEFLTAAKTGSKALDKIGKSGNLHANAGNASKVDELSGNTKRNRLDFEPSSRSRDDNNRANKKR